MFLRLCALGCLAACGIGLAAPAHGEGLASVREDQRRLANCMVSVLSELPEVTEPRLAVSPKPRYRVLITYNYRHRDERHDPAISSEEIDITDLLSGKRTGLVVPGLHSTTEDLDDADAGIFRIADLWGTRCGLELSVLSI